VFGPVWIEIRERSEYQGWQMRSSVLEVSGWEQELTVNLLFCCHEVGQSGEKVCERDTNDFQ
jgi:hypothetical protein